MLLPKKKCSALRLWIWKIDLSKFSGLPIMLIGNWTTEIITQSCFHTLNFQKFIMKKFWNSLPKEAVSLPLNSSILSCERSHLSKHVVRLRWSKEVNLTLSAKIPQPTVAMVKFPTPLAEVMVKYLGFDQGGKGGGGEGDDLIIWELFPAASCC